MVSPTRRSAELLITGILKDVTRMCDTYRKHNAVGILPEAGCMFAAESMLKMALEKLAEEKAEAVQS
jgi:hypothetical protein